MMKRIAVACAWVALAMMVGVDARAQTTLERGDVAFTGYGASGTDQFSFVLLRDVTAGTALSFTDRGWLAAGGLRPGEGAFEVTLERDYPCGTEFHAIQSPLQVLDDAGVVAGTTTGGGLQLSTSGDQLFAYQGIPPTAEDDAGLLAGLHMNGAWDADATSTNTSARPLVLADGLDALALVPEVNNARYDCSLTTDSSDVLGSAAHDSTRWVADDTTPFDLAASCGFVCAQACVAPDVPVVTSAQTIQAGESASVSVQSGSLGDAEAWHWYVDGCGATPVGTGESVEIVPSDSVVLFARGEGGCVDPGACATTSIEVLPPEPEPEPQDKDQQKCLGVLFGQLSVVAGIQAKEVQKCAKSYAKGKEPSADLCVVSDANGKVGKATQKASDLRLKKCETAPDFGLAEPAVFVAAARDGGVGFARDVLGVAFDGSILPESADADGSRCQQAVIGSAKKCLDARLKEFSRCAKAGLKAGTIASAEALAACVGSDPKGRVAAACDLGAAGEKKVDALRKSLDKRCVSAGVTPGDVLTGCGGSMDVESAHACLAAKIACRACRTIAGASDVAPPCDTHDDGVANGSCPV